MSPSYSLPGVQGHWGLLEGWKVNGIFRYATATGVQTVNLLDLAARIGQTSSVDPVIAKLLSDIRNSTNGQGLADLTDPNMQRWYNGIELKVRTQCFFIELIKGLAFLFRVISNVPGLKLRSVVAFQLPAEIS